jgi:hypothetical protein
MITYLDGDAALALLIVKIAQTGGHNSKHCDQTHQHALGHRRALSLTTERILDAADGVLHLALNRISPPSRRQFGISDSFANRRLNLAFDHLCSPNHTIFVHVDIPVEKT